MKKLMLTLATVALTGGSLINTNFEANKTNQRSKNIKNTSKFDLQATNEDAEDIANKLWNKTIKIDPNAFLNKNIKTAQEQFNAVVVKEKILTQDEVQYVSWDDLTINAARWYKNQAHFSVKKDGAICTGTDTVDASINETTAQIAAKLNNKDINLNLSYWNNKQITPHLNEIKNIIGNEKLLTKAEASLITQTTNPVTIKGWSYVPVSFVFDDGKTTTVANSHFSVNDDGVDASQIAGEINNKYFGLKTNSIGQYADSNYITKNWEDLITNNYQVNDQDAADTYLPHLKLQTDNKNVPVQILKDGQTATAHVELQCKTNPYIYYYKVNTHFLQAYVNLNASMLSTLRSYFITCKANDVLGYFYQLLDDGEVSGLPHYYGESYVPSNNVLNKNIGDFGNWFDDIPTILGMKKGISNYNDPLNAKFENNLYSQVMQTKSSLCVIFEWEYQTQSWDTRYTTIYYSFC